jgi:YqaJ-like viral recombinase domain
VKAAAKKATAPVELVEEFDCEQGSNTWHELRRGLVTASRLGDVMASGRDGGESKMRKRLLYQLAGEILSGQVMESFENDAMRRGREMEAAALENYSFTRGVDVVRIGFVRRTIKIPLGTEIVVGASPDGLVAADGIVQTKTSRPDLIVEIMDSGRFPSEFRYQCQGEMWVTSRRWCDLKIFYSGMPVSPTFRIERDDALIAQLSTEVEKFYWELQQLIGRVKAKGGIK